MDDEWVLKYAESMGVDPFFLNTTDREIISEIFLDIDRVPKKDLIRRLHSAFSAGGRGGVTLEHIERIFNNIQKMCANSPPGQLPCGNFLLKTPPPPPTVDIKKQQDLSQLAERIRLQSESLEQYQPMPQEATPTLPPWPEDKKEEEQEEQQPQDFKLPSLYDVLDPYACFDEFISQTVESGNFPFADVHLYTIASKELFKRLIDEIVEKDEKNILLTFYKHLQEKFPNEVAQCNSIHRWQIAGCIKSMADKDLDVLLALFTRAGHPYNTVPFVLMKEISKDILQSLNEADLAKWMNQTIQYYPEAGKRQFQCYNIKKISRDSLKPPPPKELGKGTYGTVLSVTRDGKTLAEKRSFLEPLEMINFYDLAELYTATLLSQKGGGDIISSDRVISSQHPRYVALQMPLASMSLASLMKTSALFKNLSATALLQMVLEILCGLHTLHSQGVAHLDLKPANILLFIPEAKDKASGISEIKVKLADFGLSKSEGSQSVFVGANLITYAYRPPEFVETSKVYMSHVEEADMFSFGIILWELVATWLWGETIYSFAYNLLKGAQRLNLYKKRLAVGRHVIYLPDLKTRETVARELEKSFADKKNQFLWNEWFIHLADDAFKLKLTENIVKKIEDNSNIIKRLMLLSYWCLSYFPDTRPTAFQAIQFLKQGQYNHEIKFHCPEKVDRNAVALLSFKRVSDANRKRLDIKPRNQVEAQHIDNFKRVWRSVTHGKISILPALQMAQVIANQFPVEQDYFPQAFLLAMAWYYPNDQVIKKVVTMAGFDSRDMEAKTMALLNQLKATNLDQLLKAAD